MRDTELLLESHHKELREIRTVNSSPEILQEYHDRASQNQNSVRVFESLDIGFSPFKINKLKCHLFKIHTRKLISTTTSVLIIRAGITIYCKDSSSSHEYLYKLRDQYCEKRPVGNRATFLGR